MNNMRLPKLDYWEPRTTGELLELLREYGDKCSILAGGTDVIPMLKRRNTSARHLVNIKKIPQLNEISYDEENGLRIGPAITLREIINHPIISKSYPLLAKAAHSVGFNQLRNMGTIGGNICLDSKCTYFNQSSFWWKSRRDCFKRGGDTCYVVKAGKRCYALSAADTVPALISLGAELIVQKRGQERRTPVEAFHTGDGGKPHLLDGKEVISSILIPPPGKGWCEGFLKKSPRGSVDFAVATLSLRLKMNGDGLDDARIALNSVSSKPIRARKTESYLKGKTINHHTTREAVHLLLKESAPLSMVGVSALVRVKTIEAMFADLIHTIMS